MTIDFNTALVVCALIASLILALQGGGARLFPILALVACTIEALTAFRVIQLSSAKVRIEVILAAVLVVTGAICWSRSATKSAITASTVVAIVGLIQLLRGIHVLR